MNIKRHGRNCTTRLSLGREANKQDSQTKQALKVEMGGKFMIWAPYSHNTGFALQLDSIAIHSYEYVLETNSNVASTQISSSKLNAL